jgi:hypothetical protein
VRTGRGHHACGAPGRRSLTGGERSSGGSVGAAVGVREGARRGDQPARARGRRVRADGGTGTPLGRVPAWTGVSGG